MICKHFSARHLGGVPARNLALNWLESISFSASARGMIVLVNFVKCEGLRAKFY